MSFTRRAVLALVAAGMAVTSFGSAQAAERWMDVYNNASQTIFYIYMSPVGRQYGWGSDLLGDDVVLEGDSYRVEPTFNRGCMYRMRVEFENGRRIESGRFNACEATEANIGNRRISIN